jgi:hypothetical protein
MTISDWRGARTARMRQRQGYGSLASPGRHLPAVVAGTLAAFLVGCGASHVVQPTERAVRVRAAQCPSPRPLRSSGDVPSSLAPDHPLWTTFCVYNLRRTVVRQTVYSGGPLDSALNGSVARVPAGYACPAWAGSPSVVVLTYRGRTRNVVVNTGGCPTLVLSNGQIQHLVGQAGDKVMAFYEQRNSG